ncbi:MAG: class I SAM-dependent methyltransferase [Ktedonobacteraceae bacterium]|nr:class I SAM-dependent methyltransferase [Ktedonobacteraceae bacterium]
MESESGEKKEQPSTYMVQDRSSQEEMERLRVQDQMFTTNMGGVLPEQSDPTRFRRVADVGCGTGGWLIELAEAYPSIKTLVGVDISVRMINYARQQASDQGVSDRVEFHVMDALRMIEFPKGYFDLVNQRFNFSYLRTWDWPNLLQKYQYAAHIGGVIRITEGALFLESTSPALNTLDDLVLDAFWRAGHLFTPGHTGVTSALPDLLHQQGLSNVQTRVIPTEYVAGTDTCSAFANDMRLAFRTMLPFLRKWTKVPDNYDQIYQQALTEMQQPDFRANGQLVTVWGTNMQLNDKLPMTEHH